MPKSCDKAVTTRRDLCKAGMVRNELRKSVRISAPVIRDIH